MAEKRAAFIFRRLRSLGFSKCRWLRTSFSVPSRSSFFFNRRNALSTDSPFFSLISVNLSHSSLFHRALWPLVQGTLSLGFLGVAVKGGFPDLARQPEGAQGFRPSNGQ